MWLAVKESIDGTTWPTAEIAKRDAETAYLEGWYWKDVDDVGKRVRFYCPNFFNTFFDSLHRGGIYKDLVGNRSAVLSELGKWADGEVHLQEAEDFSV